MRLLKNNEFEHLYNLLPIKTPNIPKLVLSKEMFPFDKLNELCEKAKSVNNQPMNNSLCISQSHYVFYQFLCKIIDNAEDIYIITNKDIIQVRIHLESLICFTENNEFILPAWYLRDCFLPIKDLQVFLKIMCTHIKFMQSMFLVKFKIRKVTQKLKALAYNSENPAYYGDMFSKFILFKCPVVCYCPEMYLLYGLFSFKITRKLAQEKIRKKKSKRSRLTAQKFSFFNIYEHGIYFDDDQGSYYMLTDIEFTEKQAFAIKSWNDPERTSDLFLNKDSKDRIELGITIADDYVDVIFAIRNIDENKFKKPNKKPKLK